MSVMSPYGIENETSMVGEWLGLSHRMRNIAAVLSSKSENSPVSQDTGR